MQFSVSAAVLALVAIVSAQSNVTVTTITGTQFVTVCPASSSFVHEGSTYTNTLTVATTITVPCPTGCVHVVPLYTTSSVICNTCTPSVTPIYPSKNTTVPAATKPAVASTAKTVPSQSMQAGAGKAAALSGASLAGLLGLAVFVL